ncbi:MAG: competence damage-inducible protein A, partial [Thermoprotei archaeon]
MEVSKRDKYEAWIFTLGNEVVEGRVVNTNAAYLGRRLTLLGYNVVGNISLIDDVEIISNYLRHVALNHRPSIIVTTGGLGPTYDDRTLEAVAKAFNRKLILNEEALRMVIEKYSERNMPITEERKKMAYLPEGSIPIPNPVGTAPGSWLEVKELNLIVISLPGVPRELEAMWEGWVEERLRIIGPKVHIVEASFTVVGVPESSAAKVLKNIVKKYKN